MLPLLDAGTIAVLEAVTASSRVGPIPNDPAHTCTIVHTPTTDDGGGAPAPGVETRYSVACLFWAVSGAEVSGDSLTATGRYRLDLAAGTVIDHTDVVEYLGRVYTVAWTPPPYEAGRIVGIEDTGAVVASGLADITDADSALITDADGQLVTGT